MTLRKLIPVSVAVMALFAGGALSAFQAQDAATAVTNKAKKAKKAVKDATDATANAATSATESAKKAVAPQKIVSDSDIAAAKASGKVWVNTDTGVYHKGGQWYGATKQGKFMTEEEATKAGYRASKTK